jgi:hypothetical protein
LGETARQPFSPPQTLPGRSLPTTSNAILTLLMYPSNVHNDRLNADEGDKYRQ